MGSAASTIAELPEELKTLCTLVDSLRNDIAILDARFINKQVSQVWKNHTLIIEGPLLMISVLFLMLF